MTMRVEVRCYRRPFRTPLRTAHGPWEERAGLILRFVDESGTVRFGEIAPIPWFGSETLAQAQAFCDRWPRQFSPAAIATIPDTLPACQFGFSRVTALSATASRSGFCPHPPSPRWPQDWSTLPLSSSTVAPVDLCALLPTGAAALTHWQPHWQAGHRCFKWKIGVAAIAEELLLLQKLVQVLPIGARLRLDANGSLTPDQAESWLAACDRAPATLEFLEQPVAPAVLLDWLPSATQRFRTAIALDESVATYPQLQQVYEQFGPQVVYVVKPAIAGWPHRLLDFCQRQPVDVVISSALETPIGRRHALALARQLWRSSNPRRALGFGVGQWFADHWATLSEETLWSQL